MTSVSSSSVCAGKVNENQPDKIGAKLESIIRSLHTPILVVNEAFKLKGKADQALCEYQANHNIDLTIMGAFTHTRIHDLLLGSFTARMLLNTHKPLLLLRSITSIVVSIEMPMPENV